ncbi:MAG: TylF/MycF/NovP-related O-methyltransferase, partial [Sulfurovaceae bacterium]
MNTVYLCAINNVLSGTCSEDCGFCTQSVKHHANIERYNYKSIDQIVSEAKMAKSFGAFGYCLVTAGKGLDDKKTEFIAKAARTVKKETFTTEGHMPSVNDDRVSFVKGLFQDSLPGFLKTFKPDKQLVIHNDSDLYSATLYVLTYMNNYLVPGTIIIFDEFYSVLD